MSRYDNVPAATATGFGGGSTPTISIVLPTYNRAEMLSQAIASVLALDEANFELLVIDDGSTDGTDKKLAQIHDARLHVVSLPQKSGAGAARNEGIARARAPFVAFLDSDDVYLPGRLTRPLEILQQDPRVGLVLSSFTTEKRTKRTLMSTPERLYDGNEMLRLIARYVLPPTTSGLTIRRDVLQRVGGFDPTLKRMQDRDLVMRVAPHAMGATIAEPLWHKRWQEDGISSSETTYIVSLIALVERHPIFQNEERGFRDYLVARHLVALAKTMKLRQLQRDYAIARNRLSPPPPPLPSLIVEYINRRRERQRLRRELHLDAHLAG